MGVEGNFLNALFAALFVTFVGIPMLSTVIQGLDFQMFNMFGIWLLITGFFAAIVVTDALGNLGSTSTFLGWLTANAIIIHVTGDFTWLMTTIATMVAILYLRVKVNGARY